MLFDFRLRKMTEDTQVILVTRRTISVPRMQEEMRMRHGSGAFGKWLPNLPLLALYVLAMTGAYADLFWI